MRAYWASRLRAMSAFWVARSAARTGQPTARQRTARLRRARGPLFMVGCSQADSLGATIAGAVSGCYGHPLQVLREPARQPGHACILVLLAHELQADRHAADAHQWHRH